MKTTPFQFAVLVVMSPLIIAGLVAHLIYASLVIGWHIGFDLGRFIFTTKENPQ